LAMVGYGRFEFVSRPCADVSDRPSVIPSGHSEVTLALLRLMVGTHAVLTALPNSSACGTPAGRWGAATKQATQSPAMMFDLRF
jgi:hypothetical protein